MMEIFGISKSKNRLLVIFIGATILLTTLTGGSIASLEQRILLAQVDIQGKNAIKTFNAEGRISSLAAGTLLGSNDTLGSHSADLFVLGGDWNLAVTNGSLSDFNVDIIMTKFDGSGKHTHYIGAIENATSTDVEAINNKSILLTSGGNFTHFMGSSDISTNGEIKWNDVPITVHLLNGNIINIMVNPVKTNYHFKALPIYGTITSITDQNGNELRGG